MKKVLLLLVCAIILLTGCSGKLTTYKEVEYKKVNEMLADKEDFILYIGSSKCVQCTSYTIALNRVIKKYQVKVYYIDITNFTEEQEREFSRKFKYNGTPTTVFIEDGEEKTTYKRINGNQPYDKIVETLRKNNYIK